VGQERLNGSARISDNVQQLFVAFFSFKISVQGPSKLTFDVLFWIGHLERLLRETLILFP